MLSVRRLSAFLLGLAPLLVQAQSTSGSSGSSGLFTPSSGDQSVQLFLGPLFGSLAGGSGNGALASLLTNFNSAAMFLGGLIVAYVLVAGTMATTGCKSGSDSGTSTASTASDKHDCKGMNSCKGKGGCNTGDMGCKGKNSCKGKGGCKVS